MNNKLIINVVLASAITYSSLQFENHNVLMDWGKSSVHPSIVYVDHDHVPEEHSVRIYNELTLSDGVSGLANQQNGFHGLWHHPSSGVL